MVALSGMYVSNYVSIMYGYIEIRLVECGRPVYATFDNPAMKLYDMCHPVRLKGIF